MTRRQQTPKLPTTDTATNAEIVQIAVSAPRLSDAQATALDLYARGFNVIPVKRHDKKPFILAPFWTSRLHNCGPECNHKGRAEIAGLFALHNVGVITGRTSGNLLALDCDTHEAFEKMGQELSERDLPYWAIAGHRGGAYLLRVIEGEVASVPKDKSLIPDVEIWGNRRLIVMPPSIHPSGDVYRWITPDPRLSKTATLPAVSIKALAWLGLQLELEKRKAWQEPELYGLPAWGVKLSWPNRKIFAEGAQEGERNKKLATFAKDLAANEIPYDEAERVILNLAYRCRPAYPQREARAILKSVYHQDPKPDPAAKRGGQVRTWQIAKDFAAAYDWRGTFGRRALKRQAVYLACVERARRDGREVWRATVREVAELANMPFRSAADGLHDLQANKLIKRTNPKARYDPAYYRFLGLSQIRTIDTTCSCSVRIVDTPKTQGEQDLFGRLGLIAWRVWHYLLDTPTRSAGLIAKALSLPRSSVYGALKNLEAENIGLVTYNPADGLHYGEGMTEASMQYLALQLTDGASRSQARKETHKFEREIRLNKLTAAAIQQAERGENE